MRALFKTVAIYLLVGPLIGLGALILSMMLQSRFTTGFSSSDIALVPLAYVFGAMPALGTGLATYWIRKLVPFSVLVMASGVIGAILSSVVWIVQPDTLVPALQFGVIPGFFAGAGSARFARNTLVRPRSDSDSLDSSTGLLKGQVVMQQLSQFEHDAIATIALIDPQREIVLAQLALATCVSRDYTGVGLYTKLRIDPAAPKLDEARWKIEDMPKGHAEHPDLSAGAGLILWVEEGYISCLESYTYDGNWPNDESLFRLTT